jgi:hypothetical protein
MPSETITDPLVLKGLIVAILNRVAVEKRPCKLCGEQIYLIPVQDSPKPIWYSNNGNPHAHYCGAGKGIRQVQQSALFENSPDPL